MAKKHKHTPHRRRRRVSGIGSVASSHGLLGQVLGAVAGAAAGNILGKTLLKNMDGKIKGAVQIAGGYFAGKSFKSPIAHAAAIGMMAVGGSNVLASFGIAGVAGIGASDDIMALPISGDLDNLGDIDTLGDYGDNVGDYGDNLGDIPTLGALEEMGEVDY